MDDSTAGLADDVATLKEAVLTAGETALSLFGKGPKSWMKEDGSPVSEADLAVDAALTKVLKAARPDYGLMSEEHTGEIDIEQRTFVIDPIDGTRAFLRGDDVWSVVVAVVEAGRPIASAILEPVTGRLYVASRGGGAFCNDEPLQCSAAALVSGARVALPGPLYREGGLGAAGIRRSPSIPSLALRLVRVAEARLDGVITKPGPHHWDLAAADLIVQEAGGTLTSLSGTLPRYDSYDTSHSPVVAAPRSLADALRSRAAEAFAAVSDQATERSDG